MKLPKTIRDINEYIMNPENQFTDRIFLVYSLISELALAICLISDIILHESIENILLMIAALILAPTVSITAMYRKKMRIGIRIVIIGFVFVLLPALFWSGGGIEGGVVVWIIFAFMFVGLLVLRKFRFLSFLALTILTAGCFVLQYLHPELIIEHSRASVYIDTFVSVIVVGAVCFMMAWIQNIMFTAENVRARKEAERAEELTRAQNRFFSSMSHEIRTPINSILGLNELILRDTEASDDIIKDARGIQGSGKMLLSLINDILDFSKMEAGSMDIVPVDYRIGDMLSEIVNMIWIKAHDKGLRFDVNVDPKVPSVLYGDEVRIKQVIINLLNNAVKYTAEGTVELHIECENFEDDNVLLNIFITDTGMGIKKESLPYLFDAFKRVDEEKNRHIEGTGLGLSIVKQIVDLMDGNIAVNSVYGEGSTFTVSIKQGISDHTEIGDLNIKNEEVLKRDKYESSFRAPEARILIVDDNEMNLEVESKLLAETEIRIDKSLSGKDALELTVRNHYDTILLDHLMPEMDGIECLEKIRNQVGGLNRTAPIIVLTANAGSDNRDMYNRAGFDGYLVKPVSGEALESTLVRYIDKEKVIISANRMMSKREDINVSAGYTGKMPVIITTSSVSDIPDEILKRNNIPIMPIMIRTDEGIFKDGVQMDADELVRYINSGKKAVSFAPDEESYTEFFASALRKAHYLIHISISTSMSPDYKIASEAAKSFDNVTVINSGSISSATGLMTLIAYKLAQQNIPVQDIVSEVERLKQRLRCSFVINTTDFMAAKGYISKRVHTVARYLNLHPCLRFKDDKAGIGGIWIGSTKRAYRKYIRKAFPVDVIPDPEIAFVTYVDIAPNMLNWIREEIRKVAYFEHVVFQQASAAVSSNCGPGTFGVLYFVKSNKSYNIGSFIEDSNIEESGNEDEDDILTDGTEGVSEVSASSVLSDTPVTSSSDGNADVIAPAGDKWYSGLEGIDAEKAIIFSGSEETFKTVLKIFYDSIDDKYSEIQGFYASEDWENYAIKVHALKSSAKLIGAMKLSGDAQLLENAGKDRDADYIREHHDDFMSDYEKYRGILAPLYQTEEEEDDRPLADEYLISSVYDALREAAEAMNVGMIEDVLAELKDYRIPDSESAKYKKVCERAGDFDYEGIIKAIDGEL